MAQEASELGAHAQHVVGRKLTEYGVPFILERLKCGCGTFLAAATSYSASLGWEVVQLVGLQTLDLAILVRVQASQPNFNTSQIS